MMSDFLSKKEKKISYEYEKNGYLVKDIEDKDSLLKIRKIFIQSIRKNIKIKSDFKKDEDILNFIHKRIKSNKLNDFRLKVINEVNENKELRKLYYNVAKPHLDILIGNESELFSLYEDLGRFCRAKASGWELWLLSGNPELSRALRMKASCRYQVSNGGIDCRWLNYLVH